MRTPSNPFRPTRLLLAVALTLGAAPSWAGVDVHLNIGVPVAPAYEVPVAPVAPAMVWSPEYGAYVAIDAPAPMFFIGGVYYQFNGGVWLSGANYWGPWVGVGRPPYALRRFHPREWGELQQRARGHMADPHWRQFHPAGRGPEGGPERGHDRGERRDHGDRGDRGDRGHP